MFIPFITTRMQRRAGSGSAGGGSKGGMGSTSKSGSGTGSSSSGKGSNGGSSSSSSGKDSSVSAGGTSKATSSYSKCGGPISTIPSSQLFAGRRGVGGTGIKCVASFYYFLHLSNFTQTLVTPTVLEAMYVPFVSTLSGSRKLYRRKGGGGGGKGGGSRSGGGKSGGAGKSGGGGKSGGSSSGSGSGAKPIQPVNTGGSSKKSFSYSTGGGSALTIPSGQPFAGRSQGGASRSQVYGTRRVSRFSLLVLEADSEEAYMAAGTQALQAAAWRAEGFPSISGLWHGVALVGTAVPPTYTTTNRPGGVMMSATFPASSSNTTFHVVADNSTVASLITDIRNNCSSVINTSSASGAPIAFNDSGASTPKPEQAVQFYRASSVALTVDGYNNTGALDDSGNTPNTPVPPWVDTNALNCLNYTIGAAVPLVDGADARSTNPYLGYLVLVWVLYHFCSFL
ncbi:uncharacterized protein BT62DRAFT_1013498 [Guyanagaster necrorhizus]|uniref:Uncharacterized protein n=1 Tax=Guyanagaster necrorhizus TaxID=856835 RepID=A0A9P7VF30_9AGAR|nr:uncharacterized protein BT62DRAFT_1013498 [Guyanagaster necrorhizus MCA 3950]KAG7439771.1 hypothetical protein BT62DRAFT_1013498 [Guyanagaster necrorhizus MCA 3950]